MRVISGKYRSIKLNSVEGFSTRPTTDKVKESIFNIIDCYNCKVLDLFAGSGALGIEALSRGAKCATFIDGSLDAVKTINKNIEKCKIEKHLFNVYKTDFLRALKIFSKNNEKFDVIFLDPPYKKGLIDIALEKLADYDLLNDEAIIMCESSSEENIEFEHRNLKMYREKKYGSILITIFQYLENDSE